jgi:hypothetical protein
MCTKIAILATFVVLLQSVHQTRNHIKAGAILNALISS